jgi:hypothetical protein
VLPACKKASESKEKPAKKAAVAVQATLERQALNTMARTLRELAAATPEPTASPAARAATLLVHFGNVRVGELPEALRAPWLEMTAVLQAATQSGPGIGPPLKQRGEAAAAALNAALAGEGLTEFRF